MNFKKVKTRLAPSPTGYFHIGTARTALFNYLFAKQNKGNFLLRIEDTDTERSGKKHEEDILSNLKWLGLNWDEGPFNQSQRGEIYQKYIMRLLDSGEAFWCFHSKEELEKEKNQQMKNNEAPCHICDHKNNPPRNPKEKGVIRFKRKEKQVIFKDLIRGELSFDCSLLGDFSIAKDEKTPLYNLAVVIDDYEMQISHIIRGEDHISNTPKQILLYDALGLDIPEFAHLPLILGPDKSKLSKRHGAVSVSSYKDQGYLPEALINFMAFLGWNPGDEREFFSLDELIDFFSLERIQKSGAVFDFERLDWINGYYIRQMNIENLTKKCIPYFKKDGLINDNYDFEYIKKVVALEQERIKKLNEIGELTNFFFADKLEYDSDLLIWKNNSLEQTKNNLEIIKNNLKKTDKQDFNKENLENNIMPLAEKHGKGDLLWPLRAALSGKKASPGPFEIMDVLGKEKSLNRVNDAINKIS